MISSSCSLIPENGLSTAELVEAANTRLSSACSLLQLLEGVDDIGTPDPEIFSDAMAGIRILIEDTSRLYEQAWFQHDQFVKMIQTTAASAPRQA
ncbi:hypothetical protein [Pseudomonas aeruginosa]|uniref:hypothetical protein n=1 Tax=Pseudomonas aeruginosa TaxID=287 RepID=UPI000F7DDADB|nr:hypothetical protein [Pseudomonas aeruginosa]RTB44126.1 hypothetical protein EJ655_08290 [Pseudomonas aeruginosa]